ncbi:hypothetical protein B0H19DRAFT_923038, partial [Mycena capillaripes]
MNEQRPVTLRSWVVTLVVFTLFGLAVVLEVSLLISTRHRGFSAPDHDLLARFSPRFITAFLPTLLGAGLLIIWQSSDRLYRELQPYVVLAKGNATAAEGLLSNYVPYRRNPFLIGSFRLSIYGTIIKAIKFRHYLILMSSATTLLGSFLQPLAGAVIQIGQIPQTVNGISIQSKTAIGLAPDVAELNAFLAAAGFAEAAVFHGLPDPPFIFGGWSVAEFEFPSGSVLNGTLSVNTTAIQTKANCEAPQSFALSTPGTSNFTIDASNSGGCSGSVPFDPEATSTSTQYGVIAVPNCGSDEVEFQPVMFWFFHRKDDDIQTPQGAAIFCNPTIAAFNVIAEVDLNNRSIISITQLDSVTTSNNVTGDPLHGQAYNSLKFESNNDTFIHARAISVAAGVSGAIFRFASQLPDGLQPIFDGPNGFLSITSQVFTQHLSISAKSIYFVASPSDAVANMTCLVSRLLIEHVFHALPAHALAGVLTVIGFSALILHLVHMRQRRRFFLAASPGSIAHIMSLGAHARFPERLYPYDDDDDILRKLKGLKFSLDPRTGAIVA